jgi:hypothetical protein
MTISHKRLALILAAACLSATVYAQRANLFGPEPLVAPPLEGADIPMQTGARRLPGESTPNLPNPFDVTHDQVGDADSFGSPLKWLGLRIRPIYFGPTCPRAGASEHEYCGQIVDQAAETHFQFRDVASIDMPAGASRSLICHWITPILRVTHQNTTSANAYSYIRYWPTLVVTSDVLRDPTLINPITQARFDGTLTIQMTSYATWVSTPVAPGQVFGEWSRDSQVCLGGPLSRRALIETYGLSEAKADAMFASPMRLTIALNANMRNVRESFLTYGVRYVGD